MSSCFNCYDIFEITWFYVSAVTLKRYERYNMYISCLQKRRQSYVNKNVSDNYVSKILLNWPD